MTAQGDALPRPAWAVTMWSDDHDIFVELPMTGGGVPYIMRYPLTEGGLSRALEVLRIRKRETVLPTMDQPANYTLPRHQPQVKLSKTQERLHAETTEAQRDNARRLLAKLGIK